MGVSAPQGEQSGFQQGARPWPARRRTHTSKKTAESLKQKRAEKHAKADAKSKIETVPHGHSHRVVPKTRHAPRGVAASAVGDSTICAARLHPDETQQLAFYGYLGVGRTSLREGSAG